MIIVRIAESMGPAVAGVPTELPKVFVIQWSMSRFHPFRRQLLGLLIIAVIALAPAAMAQEAGSETSTPRLELDEVADVPRNITVITAEEIALLFQPRHAGARGCGQRRLTAREEGG